MRITNYIKKMQSIDLQAIAVKTLTAATDDMAIFNRQQLILGLNSAGVKNSPPYASKYYSKRKNAMNPLAGFGVADLKYTGKMHKSIKFVIKKDKVINKVVDKYNHEERYSDNNSNPFLLNMNSKKALKPTTQVIFIQKLKQKYNVI